MTPKIENNTLDERIMFHVKKYEQQKKSIRFMYWKTGKKEEKNHNARRNEAQNNDDEENEEELK